MIDTLLFLGGPEDGKLNLVPRGMTEIRIATRSRLASIKDRTDLPPEGPPFWKSALYLKMEFRGNSRDFYIMVLEGITPDQVMEALIKGYKRR